MLLALPWYPRKTRVWGPFLTLTLPAQMVVNPPPWKGDLAVKAASSRNPMLGVQPA